MGNVPAIAMLVYQEGFVSFQPGIYTFFFAKIQGYAVALDYDNPEFGGRILAVKTSVVARPIEQCKKGPLVYVYVGDFTTQLCGDCNAPL